MDKEEEIEVSTLTIRYTANHIIEFSNSDIKTILDQLRKLFGDENSPEPLYSVTIERTCVPRLDNSP